MIINNDNLEGININEYTIEKHPELVSKNHKKIVLCISTRPITIYSAILVIIYHAK